MLSLKQEPIDYQPRPQGADASEKRPEDEVARLYQEPITVITHLAWSRRSDSRARRSTRSELNCTPGKRGKRGMRGEWGKSEGTHSLQVPSPLFPFLPSIIFREFFSTALLYERLEQARTRLIFVTRPTSSILMAVDNFSGYASAVALFSHFTDMSRAFDSLRPSLMINKLKAYGFPEESLSLMRSYLTTRESSCMDLSMF